MNMLFGYYLIDERGKIFSLNNSELLCHGCLLPRQGVCVGTGVARSVEPVGGFG